MFMTPYQHSIMLKLARDGSLEQPRREEQTLKDALDFAELVEDEQIYKDVNTGRYLKVNI
jgi:hypothetical protein